MAKTRYLQLTDTTMFEYNMQGENTEPQDIPILTRLIYTETKDGHGALLSTVSCECEPDSSSGYKKLMDPASLNTINHFCVPKDSQASMWYHFVDPDYKYVDSSIFYELDPAQIKVKSFSEYLKNPEDPADYPLSCMYDGIYGIRWDSFRLYFVNGYDFSNVYGMMVRVSVDQLIDEFHTKPLDLCDFFFTKDNAYKLIKYLPSPILLGNDVYDRYIEVNVPCVYDLITQRDREHHHTVCDDLNIKNNTVIKLMFSTVDDNDISLAPVEYTVGDLAGENPETDTLNQNVISENINLSYSKSVTVKGSVPTENINSDNLGCYISEVPNRPYIQFYATWRDNPLTKDIVWRFNKGIRLYDQSYVKRNAEYEVGDDYEVEHSERKWVAMHEIKLSFCMGSTVIKQEVYSMNQIFVSDSDPSIFYYRPMIFDTASGLYIDNIQIVYTMRFVNTDDNVQFIKVASMSLTGNMGKYYAMGTNLTKSDLTPYKVFNRIVENKSGDLSGGMNSPMTKYVKVFYNSTDVILDDNGENVYRNNTYTLPVSQAPKSYKFIFKNPGSDGRYKYMDLTDGYYNLMFKDSGGATVLIEPTYSTNMNMYLGELEFNISSGNLTKMASVDEQNRKMSIVAYNEDGSVSSMFDFNYTM